MLKITPVILSGGSGTRLWPLSRAALPKQFLPLVSENTMLQETIKRISKWDGINAPIVVCGNDHRFLVAEQLRELDISAKAIMLEPVGRNTAPAIAAAALALLEEPQVDDEALMLVLPSDHVIGDVDAFEKSVQNAAAAARAGQLVTFGIKPNSPEIGYGYIQSGKSLINAVGCFEVSRFVEKPSLKIAEEYLESGDFFWNSGMFLFKPSVYLAELEKFRPTIVKQIQLAFEKSYQDLDFCRLDEEAFTKSPSDSIDYAVMEQTNLAAVVPVDMGWNDVGSWAALWEVQGKDTDGNSIRGDVIIDAVQDSLIRAESRVVAAVGIKDMVIVETPDAVLVAHKDSAQDVKKIVDYLKRHNRSEQNLHTRVYRPWGWYESLEVGERFQVKRIMVKPGGKLSLQLHEKRAEHWVVVSGTALVTRNYKIETLTENQSTYIPIGVKHRLENPASEPLHLIEVQSGSYLGED
ncbi:MAG TPA: mannose-1-phosphate guanylyltransferase/mannose-6-phosphate isomerase, partial [Cellvibrio sp.]|nr:mannose-1-phosphate guanylyltransferase/mannose-6-phosphate isomerase [Cellvibrio sp.]